MIKDYSMQEIHGAPGFYNIIEVATGRTVAQNVMEDEAIFLEDCMERFSMLSKKFCLGEL